MLSGGKVFDWIKRERWRTLLFSLFWTNVFLFVICCMSGLTIILHVIYCLDGVWLVPVGFSGKRMNARFFVQYACLYAGGFFGG